MATRTLRLFLWMSVIGWGVGLGAKLFDLVVVAGAWSATPPASFALLPYGKRYPIDPGDFFMPLSAVMVVGIVGALICGWRESSKLRFSLLLALVMFLIIWAITPTVFWPMIHQLYGTATGKIVSTDAESIALARRWLRWDWFRMGLITVGFIASVRAIALSVAAQRAQPMAVDFQ